MEHLSRLQSRYLERDADGVPMHVSSLAIYDAATIPGGRADFAAIRHFLSERMHRAELFRRRLATPPLGLVPSYWFDDADFDIEYHLRYIALPKPGDWQQLTTQVARLHARPLDRERPLWECYVIEELDAIPGLAPGSFALYIKLHRATLDDAFAAELFAALHELRPDGRVSPAKRPRRLEHRPTTAQLAVRATVDTVWRPLTFAGNAVRHARPILSRTLREARSLGRHALRAAWGKPGSVDHVAPPIRFNGSVSHDRVLEGVRFPLTQVERVRAAVPHAVHEDVAVAVIGGAMRRYLEAKAESPVGSLVAEVPVGHALRARTPGRSSLADAAIVSLHTDVSDSAHRFRLVAEETRRIAAHGNDLRGTQPFRAAMGLVPEELLRFARYCARRVGGANLFAPALHTSIAGVRGPDVPLYLAGARLADYYGFAPLDDRLGLTHVVARYHGNLTIGVTACRAMMPDPAFYAVCLRASFTELLRSAGRLSRSHRGMGRVSADSQPAAGQRPSAKNAAARRTPVGGTATANRKAGKRRQPNARLAAGRTSRQGKEAK
jgi:diacylglycerol O-acyltransferase